MHLIKHIPLNFSRLSKTTVFSVPSNYIKLLTLATQIRDMPIAKPSPTEVSEAVKQLAAVQKQQACFELSLQSIDALKTQHREWQKSVQDLLTKLHTHLNHHSDRVAQPVQAPAGDITVDIMAPHDLETDPAVDDSSHTGLQLQSEESVEGRPTASTRRIPTKQGTLDDLFRTRKTVVDASNQPAGLKKLVQEEIVQTASEGRVLSGWIAKRRAFAARVVDSVWFEQPGFS